MNALKLPILVHREPEVPLYIGMIPLETLRHVQHLLATFMHGASPQAAKYWATE